MKSARSVLVRTATATAATVVLGVGVLVGPAATAAPASNPPHGTVGVGTGWWCKLTHLG